MRIHKEQLSIITYLKHLQVSLKALWGNASILQVWAKMDEGDISLEPRIETMKNASNHPVETVHIYAQLK